MDRYIVSEVTLNGEWRIWDTIENRPVAKRRHRENAERFSRSLNKMPAKERIETLRHENARSAHGPVRRIPINDILRPGP
jgi:hypothetical protein